MTEMWIEIDGMRYVIRRIYRDGYLPAVVTYGGQKFHLAGSKAEAGRAARQYWQEAAKADPGWFSATVGPSSLLGYSLEDWLNRCLDTPEEEWAKADGVEREVEDLDEALQSRLGFRPTVAYRD